MSDRESAALLACASPGCEESAVAVRSVVLRDVRLALTPVTATYVLCGGHATFYESQGYRMDGPLDAHAKASEVRGDAQAKHHT